MVMLHSTALKITPSIYPFDHDMAVLVEAGTVICQCMCCVMQYMGVMSGLSYETHLFAAVSLMNPALNTSD